MSGSGRGLPWLAPAIWTGGLLPVGALALDFGRDALGPNPVAAALHQLGLLAIVALTATLACTPVQWLTGWTWPARIRRALGLLAFTYVSLHLATYVGLDLGFAFGVLLDDLARRPFITVGFATWVLLLPLAATSTAGAVRRLGFVAWKRLHRLVYLCAGLGLVHFFWAEKKDVRQPTVYAVVVGLLLLARVVAAARRRARG